MNLQKDFFQYFYVFKDEREFWVKVFWWRPDDDKDEKKYFKADIIFCQ